MIRAECHSDDHNIKPSASSPRPTREATAMSKPKPVSTRTKLGFSLQCHAAGRWENCEHACNNCGKVWKAKDLTYVFPDIPSLSQRIEPGDECPSGECPACGALTYVDREDAVVSATIRDVMRGGAKAKDQEVSLHITADGVKITADGYGDYCSREGSGTPALLELADGELRLVAWSDINLEDHTHIVGLEGAKEKHREKTPTE